MAIYLGNKLIARAGGGTEHKYISRPEFEALSAAGLIDEETVYMISCDGSGGGGTVTVDAGVTTTGEPGTQASVVNSGTTTNAVFDFTIPRGSDGTSAQASVSRTDPDASGNRTTTITCQTGSAAPTTATLSCPDIMVVSSDAEATRPGTVYFITGS